jgi:hypothetical protein
MNTCMSCKNKTSNERCTSPRIKGLILCGRHVKSKSPRLWNVVNNLDVKVTLISKMWRGYYIRSRLQRAGPGVLKRSLCHNEEELVTMEPKDKYDPFEFFSFQEGDKIWWFDVCSILSCLNSSLVPINPYTRQPLSLETRHRLRAVYKHRLRNHMRTCHSVNRLTQEEIVEKNWMRVCQVLHENGFEDVNPPIFSRMTSTDIFIFLGYLVVDIRILAEEHPKSSRRHLYYAILKRERDVFHVSSYRTGQQHISRLIANLMHDMVDVYPFCFLVMSALYRL